MKLKDPRWSMILLCGWCLLPLGLWMLPASFFDQGQVVCLSRLLFDLECWGCGLTRAVQHAVHGEWAIAYEFNRLIVLIGPLLIVLWLKYLRQFYRQHKKNSSLNRA